MASIHDRIKPIVVASEPRRSAFTARELAEMGFRHPAEREWRTVKSGLPSTMILISILLLSWVHYRFTPLLVWSIAGIIYLIAILNSSIRDIMQISYMRPDVFVGYPFSTAVEGAVAPDGRSALDLTTEVSPLVSSIAAFAWPTWGVVSVIPPNPRGTWSASREFAGFRGAQWPFVLRVQNDDEWEKCVERLISECSLAVFDMRDKSGEGLLWEVNAAQRQLGEDHIARIENDDKGCTVLRVAGVLQPPPPDVKDYFPAAQDIDRLFETLCAIRFWLAKVLPVYGNDLHRRQRFCRVDLLLSKLTPMLLLIVPLLLLIGVFWAAKILF